MIKHRWSDWHYTLKFHAATYHIFPPSKWGAFFFQQTHTMVRQSNYLFYISIHVSKKMQSESRWATFYAPYNPQCEWVGTNGLGQISSINVSTQKIKMSKSRFLLWTLSTRCNLWKEHQKNYTVPDTGKFQYHSILEHFSCVWVPVLVTSGPYAPGPLIILKNFPSQICSRTIIEKQTAAGACCKHALEAVCISNNMVLEHIWLGKFFQIINGPDHKSRPKSLRSVLVRFFNVYMM